MAPSRLLILLAFAVVLGVPFLFRPREAVPPRNAERIVIITPHREHIRLEFARGFSEWHEEHFGVPVVIDWRQPGGTTEIRRQLQAQYTAAVQDGRIAPDGAAPPGTMPYDLLFGGGSFEHDQIKAGVPGPADSAVKRTAVSMSAPMGFPSEQLIEWFGEPPVVGVQPLYEPGQHWLGTALSGFGIAYNRDVLRRLGLPEPRSWEDLTDHRYSGWLALADPRQSGSVATTYDSILSHYGWNDGWRILRAMAANSHSFSASSAKVVIETAQGEAAACLAIDFYGRYESQALRRPGQSADESRIGYIDPPGAVAIDPDPISMLRGGPNPTVARRFVEFVLSERGQAIWQFPAKGAGAPAPELGPREFEIRRLPIRRIMYQRHFDRFIDKVDPYAIASPTPPKGWRSLIGPMFGAFAIDLHAEMRAAWKAIIRVEAAEGDSPRLRDMKSAFFAMPSHTLPDGRSLEFTEQNYQAIRNDWRDAARAAELKIAYTRFFREQYRRTVEQAVGSR